MGKVTKYSASNLLPGLSLDTGRWSRRPSEEEIESAALAVGKMANVEVLRADDGGQALEHIKKIIPPGAEVMNGSSTTLVEIGFADFLLKGDHSWKDLHKAVVSENDKTKRDEIRRKAVAAEYFISGVNAIAKTGELVACDATGSRVGAWAYAAGKLILVSGVNKIVPTLDDALQRVREYCYPLEDARSKNVNGIPSQIGKCVILAKERKDGRVTLILINDILGY
jgi:hypothetical protein